MSRTLPAVTISLIAMPLGAMLRIEGKGGWATFEMTPEQVRVLRDAADLALKPRALCETLSDLMASVQPPRSERL